MKSIRLVLPSDANAVVHAIASVFSRQVLERSGVPVTCDGAGDVTVECRITPGIGQEGYRIEDSPDAAVCISGNDERGLLYGLGKFLRTSRLDHQDFIPGTWRGSSVPQKQVRGIYFATHFHNYYHDAPIDQVQRYVEDLALWGYNVVNVWFDMHHYNGIEDPAAQEMIARLHAILQAANRIGIGASLAFLANEAYADSPLELRADWTAGHDGYFREPGGHYHVELCPNKPGAKDLLLQWVDEKLKGFGDIKLDYLWIWPYDQGGCTCSQCTPWGTNGFLMMAEPIAAHFHTAFPAGNVILSTWYFDHFIANEWSGLATVFAKPPTWVDYLMADDYGDHFPDFPLQHGVPGKLPMVNFPEISMYANNPWGGYGANPMPDHLQQLWDSAKSHLSGGFPYSEGIYEDINKAICAQFYWQADKPAMDTVREYIAYEFSPDVVEPVSTAIEILEHNLPHARQNFDGQTRVVMKHSERSLEAARSLLQVDDLLSGSSRSSWRWRILLLRGLIDAELVNNQGRVSNDCEQAFQELTRIYFAQHAHEWIAPPVHHSPS